ncbi:MAG: glycosyltransferase, partial [Rhodocyclaceae bacterium]
MNAGGGRTVHAVEWRIGGVVVVYQPDLPRLHRLVQRLAELVDEVVLINNGATALGSSVSWSSKVCIVHPGCNIGVAAALNLGVEHLEQRNCSHAWSFDQDSLPALDALDRLCSAWQAAPHASSLVALAPQIQNHTTAQPLPFLIIDENGRVGTKCLHVPTEVGAAITSGLLFRIDAWRSLGGALEPLFIDHVDTEWCWR